MKDNKFESKLEFSNNLVSVSNSMTVTHRVPLEPLPPLAPLAPQPWLAVLAVSARLARPPRLARLAGQAWLS